MRTLPRKAMRLRSGQLRPWAALTAVGLIILGQWLWFDRPLTVRPGGIAVLAGIGLLLTSFRAKQIVPHPSQLMPSLERPEMPVSWKLPFALVGIALCFYASWRSEASDVLVWDVLTLWMVGIGITIYGLVPHEAGVQWRRRLWHSLRTEKRTWVLVGVLCLVGLVLRTAWLESFPRIQAGDEAQFAYESVALKDKLKWEYSPFEMGIWHHPRTYHTLIAIAVDAFGQTRTAARLPSAIFGALTVPAVYFMGRRLFDHRVGLVAAIFMMSFPVHIQFSRTGMDQTGDPFFAALTFAFLTRALRDGDLAEAALAGLTMGLSQYFYFAGRLIPLLCLGCVGLYALVNWRSVLRRGGALVVTLVVAGVVVFPSLYASYQDKTRPLSPRLQQVSIWATGNVEAASQRDELRQYWTNQIQHSYLAYVQAMDESDVYGRYNPLMGWFAGVPLIVGLTLTIQRWRDPRFIILGIWIIGTATLGGLLLVDPPHYPRYISATPALAVLVGLGLVGMGMIITDVVAVLPATFQRLRASLMEHNRAWYMPVILALALSAGDQMTYIIDYAPRDLLYGETTKQLNDVVDILKMFDGHYTVWFFSSLRLDFVGPDLIRYLTPENNGLEYQGDIDKLEDELPTHGPHAFVVAPERFDEIVPRLLFKLPGGELREYTNERMHEPLVYVYFVDVP
jgi:hypothetical protein